MEFLGHIFDATGVHIKEDYRQAVKEWPPLQDKADLDQFLGLINYFKNWIDGYSRICAPLNALRKKDAPWVWTNKQETAVNELKEALLRSPVLHYYRPDLETIVHTDASAYAIGGWIGQKDEQGEEHPIVYWSRKMLNRELNYSVYEQELLALVEMLRVGRPYLDGRPFRACTDHRALQWLQTQAKSSKGQAGWIERLQAFDMTIEYVPGAQNHVADMPKNRTRLDPTDAATEQIGAILELGGIQARVIKHMDRDEHAELL